MGKIALLLPVILLPLIIHISTTGAYIDVYTQFGGEGLGQHGGEFHPSERVQLYAKASYNNWPEQNVLVAFEVINANGETVYCVVNSTDQDGIAYTSFRIPNEDTLGTIGTWFVVVTANIAGIIVSDNLTFTVLPWNFTLTIETYFSFYGKGLYPFNGVKIWVDGKVAGYSPLTISVEQGYHQIEVSPTYIICRWTCCLFKCWDDGVTDNLNVIYVNESRKVIVYYEIRYKNLQPC